MKKKFDAAFFIEVMFNALAATALLSTWFLHPATSSDMEEAGRWLVCLLIAGVVAAAIYALVFPGNMKSRWL